MGDGGTGGAQREAQGVSVFVVDKTAPGVTTRAVNYNAVDLPAAHVFKISEGKMHQIEAMGFRADYLSPTGW